MGAIEGDADLAHRMVFNLLALMAPDPNHADGTFRCIRGGKAGKREGEHRGEQNGTDRAHNGFGGGTAATVGVRRPPHGMARAAICGVAGEDRPGRGGRLEAPGDAGAGNVAGF
jgi:hypothetical protein